MQTLLKAHESMDVTPFRSEVISQPEYSADPQAGSLLDYWHAICARKRALTLCGLLGLGIGLAAVLVQTPMYRATSAIEIQDSKGDDQGTKILSPQADSAVVDAFNDIQTQVKILQSQSVIDHALVKADVSSMADLRKRPEGSAPWLGMLHLPAAQDSRDNLIEQVSKHLKVHVVSDTRIVEISYEAADPTLAARFVNALTSEFIAQNMEARILQNRKTSGWLVSQLDEMRVKLQHSEDALQQYAREKGLIYTADKQNISEEKLREVQTQLSAAQADRMEKESRFEIARSVSPETIPEVMNDTNLKAMQANISDLRKQQAEMAVTFKSDYTKAKELKAEIDSLESTIEQQRSQIVSRLGNELQESQHREQLLKRAYALQTGLVTSDSQKSIQYDMLKHDVDTNREIYQSMLQKVKEYGITSALKATNVRIIDPAKAPLRPFKPNLPLNTVAGLILGLMLGVSAIVIRSKADGNVQEPGDAGMLLGIPELGVIPAAQAEAKRTSSKLGVFSGKNSLSAQSLEVVKQAQFPQIADSYRAVLASILFASARHQQRTLVVTSASEGEGKTTTTVNLAVALANMGRKVLLIDGDIRSPRIDSLLGLKNSAGLTTTLKDLALDGILTDAFIQNTQIENLHVLTSGPALQAGVDLLFSNSMPALIAQFRKQYDMVLIDTPPMLVMPDARLLGRLADAVILIARSGKTARSAIQAAYRRFVEDRTPVLGVVLNGWNAEMSPNKYYAAYKQQRTETGVVNVSSVRA